MSPQDIDRIASAYPKTWDRCYVRSKLKSDPLYDAVLAELKDHDLPLLDLGCGLGLTAFYLRDSGMKSDMLGLDYDERKIEGANAVVRQRQDEGFRFEHHDARQGLPEHQGHVTILDILQFFMPEEVRSLLQQAAERVPEGGKLVVRSGLKDDSWRFKVTVAGDLFAKLTSWMKAAPTCYPTAEDFEQTLSPFGKVRISPLWGPTPFNNHLIVLER